MQITACCDIGAFEQEVNQLRTHQGQSDVFVINKRGALLWSEHQSGTLTARDLENAAFTVFLYGRMIGAAAEIDDHLNRGRNMDTRTPEANCSHVL